MTRLLHALLVFFIFLLPGFNATSATLIILERSGTSTFTQELNRQLKQTSFNTPVYISFVDAFYSSLSKSERSKTFPLYNKAVMLIAGIDETTPITRIISQGSSAGMFLEQYPDFFPAAERLFTHILWAPKTGQRIPSDINLRDSIKHISQLFPNKSHLLLVGNYNGFSSYLTERLLENQSESNLALIKTDYQESVILDSTPPSFIKDTVALVTHPPQSQQEQAAFNWLKANHIPVLFLFSSEFDLIRYKNVGGLVVSPFKLGSLIEKIVNNNVLTKDDMEVTVALYHNDALAHYGLDPASYSEDYQIVGRIEYSYEEIQYMMIIGLLIFTLFLIILLIMNNKNRQLLNERASNAEYANREKDKLMANISHELRTPLNAIHLAFDVLTDHSLDKSDKVIDAGKRATKHLKNIINTILDYQKSSNHETLVLLDWFNTDELKHAIQIHQYHAQKKALQFAIKGMDKLPNDVKTDEKLLLQIVHNVLSNALKFTERGSISVSFKHTHSHLDIEVVDTGIGMDEPALESVFVPFKQADPNGSYEGTGLGMALCKTLISLLKGEIQLDSTLGQGTRVLISLPVEWRNTLSHTDIPPPANDTLPLSVLLVEDDDISRELCQLILKPHVQKLLTTASAHDALSAINHYCFDVVLTDVRMPEMDGVALFKKLRERSPNLPIIAVTGNASPSERRHYLELGFTAVIAKPFEVHDIIEALQMVSREPKTER